MKISVIGLGMVSRLGGTEELEHLLSQNLINPSALASQHTIALADPKGDSFSPQLFRRMNHFAKIALLSADAAIRDSGLDLTGKSIGIIQGSVYGPIISGIQALDDLIDYGDNQLSPTNFSGSVFNISATYLSLAFGIQGPTLTHTSGLDTLYNSLLTASHWFENGGVDYVIMGVGDEYATFFGHNFLTPDQPTGLLPTSEGWTTFILSKDEAAKYGRVELGYLKSVPKTMRQKNIYSVWHEQLTAAEFLNHARYNRACFPAHLRGSYPSAAAFDLALALICKKMGRFPVYNAEKGNYQIEDLNKSERINCYSNGDNQGVFIYDIY